MKIVNLLSVSVIIHDVAGIGDYMGPLMFRRPDNPITVKIRYSSGDRIGGIAMSEVDVDRESVPGKTKGIYYIVPQELCDASPHRNDFFTPCDGSPNSHTWVTTGLRWGLMTIPCGGK